VVCGVRWYRGSEPEWGRCGAARVKLQIHVHEGTPAVLPSPCPHHIVAAHTEHTRTPPPTPQPPHTWPAGAGACPCPPRNACRPGTPPARWCTRCWRRRVGWPAAGPAAGCRAPGACHHWRRARHCPRTCCASLPLRIHASPGHPAAPHCCVGHKWAANMSRCGPQQQTNKALEMALLLPLLSSCLLLLASAAPDPSAPIEGVMDLSAWGAAASARFRAWAFTLAPHGPARHTHAAALLRTLWHCCTACTPVALLHCVHACIRRIRTAWAAGVRASASLQPLMTSCAHITACHAPRRSHGQLLRQRGQGQGGVCGVLRRVSGPLAGRMHACGSLSA